MDTDSLRRRRLAAFVFGVASLAVLLWRNPTVPDALGYVVVGVAFALCYYGLSTRSARTVAFRMGLVVAGLIVGNALADAGVL